MVAHPSDRLGEFRHVLEQPTELVKEYPLSSMLMLFGVGLGVGVVIGQAMCSPMLHAMHPEPTMTERVSRQIYDTVSNVLPQAIARHMHS